MKRTRYFKKQVAMVFVGGPLDGKEMKGCIAYEFVAIGPRCKVIGVSENEITPPEWPRYARVRPATPPIRYVEYTGAPHQ